MRSIACFWRRRERFYPPCRAGRGKVYPVSATLSASKTCKTTDSRRNTASGLRLPSLTYVFVRSRQAIRAFLVFLATAPFYLDLWGFATKHGVALRFSCSFTLVNSLRKASRALSCLQLALFYLTLHRFALYPHTTYLMNAKAARIYSCGFVIIRIGYYIDFLASP